jgi:O-acetyl-ADP-ribose deacetylase (regulator of RNase III)
VNSVGTHLSLQCGGCAQAIATAAGDDLQAELYSKSSPSGAALGDVYVTRGYKLPCKYVLHAICYPYDPQHAVQVYMSLKTYLLHIEPSVN